MQMAGATTGGTQVGQALRGPPTYDRGVSEHENEQPREVLFLVGSGDPLELIASRGSASASVSYSGST